MNATANPAAAPVAAPAAAPVVAHDPLLEQIREVNFTYLMLAQQLIRHDLAAAVYRLGVSEESAELIAALSPAQVLKLASSNTLLCRMRADENMVWSLLTSRHSPQRSGNDTTQQLHASILMAGRLANA